MSVGVDLSALEGRLDRQLGRVKRAKLAARALEWLDTYGDSAARDRTISFDVSLSFASACAGSDHATSYMEAAARNIAATVVEAARTQARSDIASAIEAATAAETPQDGSVHESATAKPGRPMTVVAQLARDSAE